ncbi:MAG: P27 family phage terminase small subunit [Clostridiaceae bacterium]|nr:P27 family phage terminase small subunit [Clostridiaceae bacterium]
MARPSKPINLMLLEGKTHLTKKQIADRLAKEESLRTKRAVNPNKKVEENPCAFEMFKKLQELYKNIEYVDGLDENIINRYCLLTAEVDSMEQLLERMNSDIDKCESSGQMVTMYKSISGLEGNLNRSRDMLLKMEDRLFLNPTARVKNVPKKQEKPQETDFDRKFGNV